MDSPPNYPVIVVHTDDGNGLTACVEQPIRLFGQYRTPNAASQPMTEADVLVLARSLEGASEEWVCFLDGSYEDRCRRPEDIDRNDPLDIQWHGNCGRHLVIPLPEGEEK